MTEIHGGKFSALLGKEERPEDPWPSAPTTWAVLAILVATVALCAKRAPADSALEILESVKVALPRQGVDVLRGTLAEGGSAVGVSIIAKLGNVP